MKTDITTARGVQGDTIQASFKFLVWSPSSLSYAGFGEVVCLPLRLKKLARPDVVLVLFSSILQSNRTCERW